MHFFLFLIVWNLALSLCHAQEVTELNLDEPTLVDPAPTYKEWHLGIGNYFDMPRTMQTNSRGQKNGLSFWPTLYGGRNYLGVFTAKTFLEWNILFAAPKSVGESDLVRTLLALDILIGRDFAIWGSLSFGISFFQTFLFFKDSGATQTESSSDSSTFYRPNKWIWVSQQVMTVAYRHKLFSDHFSVEARSYVFSLWDSKERNQSYALNFLYHW